jgi:CheY-like chemotaxis protein
MNYRKVWKNLIIFFAEAYDKSTINILFGKYIALFGHTGYWFLWTYIFPQQYDSAFVRFAAIALFIPFLFEKFITSNVTSRAIFGFYWYVCVGYNLAFLFTYLMLMNNFSGMWLICETMAISMVITIIPNVLVVSIVYTIGIISAYFTFLANSNFNLDLNQTHLEYFLIVPMIITGGLLFNFSAKFGELKLKLSEQKAETIKSLAGTIAHELRNPLNSINLAQNQVEELLLKSTPSKINQDIKQQLVDLTSSISSSITQANNTINIILADLSNKTVEEGDFSYLSTDQILPEIIKTFGYSNLDEREKVKLNLQYNFIFKAVNDRFIFIIYNLLKNALYYLNQFPDFIVNIGTEQKKIDEIEYNIIYVHDTGLGIAQDVIPKLFDNFYTSGKKYGTGLGLSFCKRNMKIFGGDIICESEYNQGKNNKKNGWTKFSLLFPKLSNEEIKRAAFEYKRKKILLVDDQEINLIATKSRIENFSLHISCDTATSVKEAIVMVKKNKYHLILIDIEMQKMNGVEAGKKIKLYDKEIPVIAFTSLDKESFLKIVKTTSSENFFNYYLNKLTKDHLLYRGITKWIEDSKDDLSYVGTKEDYLKILKDKKVILADDQETNRLMTRRILEKAGLIVSEVSDGKEFLDIYQKSLNVNGRSDFDIIIADINMPVYNGDEVSMKIRKIEALNKISYHDEIPIIALSGDGSKKDIYNFLECQMTDYFIKGSKYELLLRIVANWLML